MSNEMDMSIGDDDGDRYCQSTLSLQTRLKSVVEDTLKQVPSETFIKAYKTCYSSFQKKTDVSQPALGGSSTEARKYREQFNAIIIENMNEVISETLVNMDSKLKALEELKESQENSTFVWRPPGNALEHMVPYNYASKVDEKRELERKLEKENEEINLLMARLTQKRAKAKRLFETLNTFNQNIENIARGPINERV